jgi:hypothetical protein
VVLLVPENTNTIGDEAMPAQTVKQPVQPFRCCRTGLAVPVEKVGKAHLNIAAVLLVDPTPVPFDDKDRLVVEQNGEQAEGGGGIDDDLVLGIPLLPDLIHPDFRVSGQECVAGITSELGQGAVGSGLQDRHGGNSQWNKLNPRPEQRRLSTLPKTEAVALSWMNLVKQIKALRTKASQPGAQDLEAMTNRVQVLELLYEATRRGSVNSTMHGLYTGLAAEMPPASEP